MAIKNEETRMKLMKLMSKLHAQQNETVLIRTKQLILKVNDQQCLLLLIVLTLTQDYPNFFFLNKQNNTFFINSMLLKANCKLF